jgi:hypothetical protein
MLAIQSDDATFKVFKSGDHNHAVVPSGYAKIICCFKNLKYSLKILKIKNFSVHLNEFLFYMQLCSYDSSSNSIFYRSGAFMPGPGWVGLIAPTSLCVSPANVPFSFCRRTTN